MKKTLTFLLAACALGASAAVSFQAAKPVWPAGRETRMNDFAGFLAMFALPEGTTNAILRITASSVYRAHLNGAHVGYGPARAAKGFFRVDEWPLGAFLVDGVNTLEIEVSAYNCNTYYICEWPAFLQAEVVADGKVLARTSAAGDDFTPVELPRVRKVSRFSFQRGFGEAYRADWGPAMWWRDAIPPALAEQPPRRLLARGVPYPDFAPLAPMAACARTEVTNRAAFAYRPVRQVDGIGRQIKGYPAETLEVNLWRDVQSVAVERLNGDPGPGPWPLARSGVILDNGREATGFPMVEVVCRKAGRLVVTFDEVLTEGRVDPIRFDVANAVVWDLKPGAHALEAFEPYSLRYAHVYAVDGEMELKSLRLRAYENPIAKAAAFACSDPSVARIFDAARATFAQNAADLFMDCPSRERAGWLCDSFFLGRAGALFTGATDLERNFLENYALPKSFDDLPAGALPMCYPSDNPNGVFIPNWMMWFVLELDDYAGRGGDAALVARLRPRMRALYRYLSNFRNSDGLLERLPSWIFIEWSHANDLVRDVNYPSNMLWAECLDALARLYGEDALAREAAAVRAKVREQAWTGAWFGDNARRQADGSLKLTGECTETCQYYAFAFGTATRETHGALWNTLVTEFGPKRFDPADRKKLLAHPEIAPSNAFIGNYLRLELLARAGLSQQLLDETKGYFTYMVDRTGTLWEHDGASASCNHGFASYVAVLYVRALLGLESVDPVARRIVARPPRNELTTCRVTLPTPDGPLAYGWTRDGADLVEDVSLPAGWHR